MLTGAHCEALTIRVAQHAREADTKLFAALE